MHTLTCTVCTIANSHACKLPDGGDPFFCIFYAIPSVSQIQYNAISNNCTYCVTPGILRYVKHYPRIVTRVIAWDIKICEILPTHRVTAL